MTTTATLLHSPSQSRPESQRTHLGVTSFRILFTAVLTLAAFTWSGVTIAEEALTETPITDDDRDHWSFQLVADVAVPPATFPDWQRNEIDAFVGRRLKSEGLRPQPAADVRTLSRRMAFDLIGLPPTALPADKQPTGGDGENTAGLIDSLLASPHYGERWGQHWLDLARFAETDGFEHDKLRPEAWKFRDWVIRSLNEDMPYDEFLRQQIAGDELYPNDDDALTATRFCLSGPDMPDINLLDERRHTVLNEITSTIGEVVLGLQLGCAQCHDHKYDPISQADFYRMRAFFEPSVPLRKNKSLSVLQHDAKYSRTSHVMLRGDFRSPGPEISPGVIRLVDYDGTPQTSPKDSSSGLRTRLANWITSERNPLTARVIVNRVWQHHFGTGLVDTPSDFGLMGSWPEHAELLDWLSDWLVRNNWSLKKLHRLIMSSATYRQQSFLPAASSETERTVWVQSLSTDPDCRLLSRFPRRRLEGEIVRDRMLLTAGILNTKMGGPGVRPPLPKEIVGTLLRNQWNVTKDESEHYRRSIYVFARRNLRFPIFEAFDRPSANASCSVRPISTTAPQSLFLLNSKFTFEMARRTAQRIQNQTSDDPNAAFELILGRSATNDELAAARDFLKKHSEEATVEDEPMTHLCLTLFNSNEFLFVD